MFVLEGNIGAGKTTLLNRLKAIYPDVEVVPEPVCKWVECMDSSGQSIFQKFYEDPERFAFAFQMYVTLTRLRNTEEKSESPVPVKNALSLFERSVYSDKHVFMQTLTDSGVVSEIESNIYNAWFDRVTPPPESVSGIIYLKVDPEECHKRIAQRNRDCEGAITPSYLQQLHASHERWLSNAPNVLVIKDCSDTELAMVHAFMEKRCAIKRTMKE